MVVSITHGSTSLEDPLLFGIRRSYWVDQSKGGVLFNGSLYYLGDLLLMCIEYQVAILGPLVFDRFFRVSCQLTASCTHPFHLPWGGGFTPICYALDFSKDIFSSLFLSDIVHEAFKMNITICIFHFPRRNGNEPNSLVLCFSLVYVV